MKRKLPPLNWLRAFECSARNLSFKLAAGELNLTSAAVSKQIKNLEYNLGVTLFNRLPNGLELTDHGAIYLAPVREAIERLTNATHDLFGKRVENILNIKVSLVFSLCWLAPRIHRFYQQYPTIDLRVNSNLWVNDGPLEADYDFEIRYGRGTWSGLNSDRLTWDQLMPVCSKTLMDAGRLTQPEDLKHHTVLNVIGYEEGWAQWLASVGMSEMEPRSEKRFDTLISTLDLAERGLGVALGRSSLIAERLEQGKLVTPFEHAIATDEAFYLVYPHSAIASGTDVSELKKSADLFKEWILSESGQG